jgi:hypothetical protein
LNLRYDIIETLDAFPFVKDIGTQYVPKLAHFFDLLVTGTASQQDAHEKGSNFVSNNVYYFFHPDEAATKTTEFFKSVTAEKGKSLWDLTDNSIVKKGLYFKLPRVDTSVSFKVPVDDLIKYQEITEVSVGEGENHIVLILDPIETGEGFIKKVDGVKILKDELIVDIEEKIKKVEIISIEDENKEQEIKIESIEEIIEFKIENIEIKDEVKKEIKTSNSNNIDLKTKFKHELDGNISMEVLHQMHDFMEKQLNDFVSPDINGRLISPYKIENNLKVETNTDFPTFKLFENLWAKFIPTHKFDESKEGCVMFHIHGGGFVAMSSSSHEGYLRRWAVDSGIPIVSMDYRKAPEHKFPISLEECFQAYKWLLKTLPVFCKISKN